MEHFRKFWTEEKRQWILSHKSQNRTQEYKDFCKAFNCADDLTFNGFCNERCRVGASTYHRPRYSTCHRPINSIQYKKGYKRIKIAEPNVWIQYSRYVYQKAHPEYTFKKGDWFLHLDGDRENNSAENLEVCTKRECGVFQMMGGVVKGHPELTKINLLKARLALAKLDRAEKAGLTSKYGNCRAIRAEKAEWQRKRKGGMTKEEWLEFMKTHTHQEMLEFCRKRKEIKQ